MTLLARLLYELAGGGCRSFRAGRNWQTVGSVRCHSAGGPVWHPRAPICHQRRSPDRLLLCWLALAIYILQDR